MTPRNLRRLLALLLIGSTIYQTAAAAVYIYRLLSLTDLSVLIQRNLLEQGVILSANLCLDLFYGLALLVKPSHTVKLIHLILGGLLLLASNLLFAFVL